MKFETLPYYARKGTSIPRKELFNNLKRLYLQKSGMTKQDLAAQLEVSPQYLCMWASITNKRNPPLWSIIRLCSWLDCHILITPDTVKIQQNESDY
jgi:DNA-binding XRE family transcriptional regulator|tara:strand:+ start:19283 stop:19570 length:288 start_codon:yes stop_codon:yes gene_type:complete